jgi:predicted Zn finger-like uncharacterized protein
MTLAVNCPHCRTELDIPTQFAGRAVRCASCQQIFNVPVQSVPVVARRSTPVAVPIREPRRSPESEPSDEPPRSNLGVWILLMVVGFALTGLCAWFILWHQDQVKPKMEEYKDENEAFQVKFPVKAKPKSTSQTLPDGRPVVGAEASLNDGQVQYAVRSFPLSAKQKKLAEKELFEGLEQQELVNIKNNFSQVDRQMTTHNGYPALDVWLRGGMLGVENVIVRIVKTDTHAYSAAIRGLVEPRHPIVSQFFLSLEIPPQKVKKPEAK